MSDDKLRYTMELKVNDTTTGVAVVHTLSFSNDPIIVAAAVYGAMRYWIGEDIEARIKSLG
jgi:hypothetical protein